MFLYILKSFIVAIVITGKGLRSIKNGRMQNAAKGNPVHRIKKLINSDVFCQSLSVIHCVVCALITMPVDLPLFFGIIIIQY